MNAYQLSNKNIFYDFKKVESKITYLKLKEFLKKHLSSYNENSTHFNDFNDKDKKDEKNVTH